MRIEAEVTAKWWADQLRGGARLDNGDKSQTGVMCFMMGKMAQTVATEEQLIVFEQELGQMIEAEMEQGRTYLHIGVDYGPCQMLADAAEKAGMSTGISDFPWKTWAQIRAREEVSVAAGYGSEVVHLWRKEAP